VRAIVQDNIRRFGTDHTAGVIGIAVHWQCREYGAWR